MELIAGHLEDRAGIEALHAFSFGTGRVRRERAPFDRRRSDDSAPGIKRERLKGRLA
jgi:hypothetical protein